MALDAYPQKVTLKDGRKVELTVFSPKDRAALLGFYRALPVEERQVLKDDVSTEGWADRFIAKVNSGEVISLVGKVGAEIVAEGSLYRNLHGWMRHVGDVRLNVAMPYRRAGLGYALAAAVVKVATDVGIEKIIAQVVESQIGARRTFEKLHFHHEAVLAHHVQDISGIRRDLFILANDVSDIWRAMEVLTSDVSPYRCEE